MWEVQLGCSKVAQHRTEQLSVRFKAFNYAPYLSELKCCKLEWNAVAKFLELGVIDHVYTVQESTIFFASKRKVWFDFSWTRTNTRLLHWPFRKPSYYRKAHRVFWRPQFFPTLDRNNGYGQIGIFSERERIRFQVTSWATIAFLYAISVANRLRQIFICNKCHPLYIP